MRESCTYGSVRGALSNERPYRDRSVPTIADDARQSMVGTAKSAFAHPTLLISLQAARQTITYAFFR